MHINNLYIYIYVCIHVCIVLAEMINPKMAANLYLDGKEHESEIKQVFPSSFFSFIVSTTVQLILQL